MTNESIQAVNLSPQIEKGHASFFEKSISSVRIKDPFLSNLAGISMELYQIALTDPGMVKTLKEHPGLIFLLKTNPKLLNVVLQNPTFLDDLMSEPAKFLGLKSKTSISDIKKEISRSKSDEFVQSKLRKLDSLKNLEKLVSHPGSTSNQGNKSEFKINPLPHQLESEVIAKAHMENPNTGTPIGEFKQISRANVPHDLELRPDLITNARAFSLSPELLALMSAQAIIASRTKKLSATGNPDDDDFAIEDESEKNLLIDPDELHEIEKINESESVRTIKSHEK